MLMRVTCIGILQLTYIARINTLTDLRFESVIDKIWASSYEMEPAIAR